VVIGVGAERGIGAAVCRRCASAGHHQPRSAWIQKLDLRPYREAF